MVRGGVLLWLLVVLRGLAQAEPESTPSVRAPHVDGIVAFGIGVATNAGSDNAVNFQRIAAIQLDVGVAPRSWPVTVGLHVGFNSSTPLIYVIREPTGPAPNENFYHLSLLPMQVGLSAHIVVNDRFYVIPWAGVQIGWDRTDCESSTCPPGSIPTPWVRAGTVPAFGAGIGGDALEVGAHRLTFTASIIHAVQDGDLGTSYTGMWIGVGYRFWNG